MVAALVELDDVALVVVGDGVVELEVVEADVEVEVFSGAEAVGLGCA